MNYQPVVAGNQHNSSAGIQENFDAGKAGKESVSTQQYEPESEVYVSPSSSDKTKKHDEKTKREAKGKSHVELSTGVRNLSEEFEDFSSNSTNGVSVASTPVTDVGPKSTNTTSSFDTAGPSNNAVSPTFKFGGKASFVDPPQYPDDPNMPALEENIYSDDEEDVGAKADFSNLETSIPTRSMVKEQGGLTQINDEDSYTCMFACFISQEEPKRVHQALKDPSWIEAMQEKLLQFKMQKVWVLVDLLKGKRAIESKWDFRNKKDEKGIVVRNKARLVA
nr:putative ribonuclease H-like domain-containing protein [Tanacetum cinerariifolium]